MVDDDAVFAEDILHAVAVAREEKAIVTVGIEPTHPSTGYGYLGVSSDSLEVQGADPDMEVRKVLQFKEKPDHALAKSYLDSGKWWWNAGIFVFRFGYMAYVAGDVDERFDVLMSLLACVQQEDADGLAAEYARMPAVSLDHGIIEAVPELRAVPARFGWSDLGSWDAMQAIFSPGEGGVSRAGKLVAADAKDNIVYAPGKAVALLGVSNLVVVATDHGVLVLPKERAQEVRALVAKLGATGSGV